MAKAKDERIKELEAEVSILKLGNYYFKEVESLTARLKVAEEALDLVIPRCLRCYDYATKFNPIKLWPICDAHILDAGGATQVITYHRAIKATEVLKKLKADA